jgi:multidrug resistance efflux pump
MDQLEDSTLDLIRRRSVRSSIPGYVVMAVLLGVFAALPLVKVDVVTTVRGMVRPLEEPAGIRASITGILDSTILMNNMEVNAGDTLAWIRRDQPEARIREYSRLMAGNLAPVRDIRHILEGKEPEETGRYMQSYRNHMAALSHLLVREKFLQGEYVTAGELYMADVIPRHEYEQAEEAYLEVCTGILDMREQYRDRLEEALYRLEQENRDYRGEIALIRSVLHDYFILAPATGTVHNCPGLTEGSVVHSGMSLGSVSPSGCLVAECYLDPGSIQGIREGTPVRLRFDEGEFRYRPHMEASVDHIEKDVTLVNGKPVYRIRCVLDPPYIMEGNGKMKPVIKGMTFTASFMLFRRPVSSLLMERLNRWANPAGSTQDNENE